MKRLLSTLMVFFLLLTFLPIETQAIHKTESATPNLSTQEYQNAEFRNLPSVRDFDFDFLPVSGKWAAMTAGIAPATFKQVTYQLAPNVVELKNSTISDKIATAGQLIAGSTIQEMRPERIIQEGGFIKQDVLDQVLAQMNREAKPGLIVVDSQAGISFKVGSRSVFSDAYGDTKLDQKAKALENTYMIEQPRFNEVFKDFSLGGANGEIVDLTRSNIQGFAANVEDCVVLDAALQPMAFGDSIKDFEYLTGENLINLQFNNTTLTYEGSGGKKLTIRLSGGLGVSKINVNAKYSAFGGYHLILNAAEEFYLVAEVQSDLKEEVRIPLFGIDIPFGIGRVSGGLFLIIGVDGNIRIEAEAREYTSATMGVKGKTAFGVPVSVKGVFSKEFIKDGDVDIAGKINGYVKVGPLLDISLLGMDLVGAGAFVGVGLGVTSNEKILDINLYALLQIYFKIIGKTVNLINWTPTLLRKRQMDTGGYRVHVEEAYIKIGRVGGYLEDTRSIEGSRVPPGIKYRILVFPIGTDPLNATPSKYRTYPSVGWQETSIEGEFFIEEGENMLNGGDKVVIEFVIENETYRSDPMEVVFPYDTVTIEEVDYFNDVVTGNVAPVKVINYDAQQVAKPGDPADKPEVQFSYRAYDGSPLHLQGMSGIMLSTLAGVGLPNGNVYMPFQKGGEVLLITDEHGNFDSRNPQMLPENEYDPVYNGVLQILPGAKILGDGKFDTRKTKGITSVKVSFDVLGHTSSHTIMVNPTLPISMSRTVVFIENSYQRRNEGNKIIDQMQFDETVTIVNEGGDRALTQAELVAFFDEGWTTQDIIGFKGGKFLGDDDGTAILSHHVSDDAFTITPILDEQGNPTSSVSVSNRVIVEWVWQEHPLMTKITSVDHATVSAGESFQAIGSGIRPLRWSLKDAPEGITVDPTTGKISVAASVPVKDHSFTVRLEQDPAYFQPEKLQTSPMSNASFGFGFTKSSLDTIMDFITKNLNNPAMNGEPPINFIGHYPSPAFEQKMTLTVTKSTRPEPLLTAPIIASARHGYRFTMTSGASDLNVGITATGSTPMTWSLISKDNRRIPSEITIQASSGVLSVKKSIAAGTYTFTVKAQNSVGNDTQDCIVVVAPARTPPVINEETHGYIITKLINAGDLFVPIAASGSTPITWSLQRKSDRYIIPTQITIDPVTGVLTVKEGIEAGKYTFIIRAENDKGFDTQECVINVVSIIRPPRITSLTDYTENGTLDNKRGTNTRGDTGLIVQTPSNRTTIRVDHAKDRYTYDRTHVNGAEFIRWNSVIKLNIEGSKEELTFAPTSQMCDSYHIYIDMSDPNLKNLVTTLGKRIQDIKDARGFLGAYLQKQVDQYVTNPWKESINEISGLQIQSSSFEFLSLKTITQSTLLNYGATVGAIMSEKGGTHNVELGGEFGTSVTGKFFVALAQNPTASLSFLQEGASITFKGKDIRNAQADVMFDFGFAAEAEHGEQIKTMINTGESTFVYSFLGHGELPGTATFAITTDIAEGTKVYVYKFDSITKRFTQIAGNVSVGAGGVVTYKNKSMSEYVITTEKIKGTQTSSSILWFGIVAAAIGIALWFILRRRVKKVG